MIRFVAGNLFMSDATALVNPVNTVGVMGKGLALQFKEAFPANFTAYVKACKNGTLTIGELLVVWDEYAGVGKKLIINFPTKQHWRQPSKYEYIEQGLSALKKLITEESIPSIAIPPLGAGLGGLDWAVVKTMIVTVLEGVAADITVYEPQAI